MDMMLLVIDVTKGMQAQTVECVVIGEAVMAKTNGADVIIVLNKVQDHRAMRRFLIAQWPPSTTGVEVAPSTSQCFARLLFPNPKEGMRVTHVVIIKRASSAFGTKMFHGKSIEKIASTRR